MDTRHLSGEDAERFVSGRLEREDYSRALRHLAADCDACKVQLAPYLPLLFGDAEVEEPAGDLSSYDGPVDRAIRSCRALVPERARENERIPRLVSGLLALPTRSGIPDLRQLRPRVRSCWALVEALLAASHELRFRDRRKMLDFAMFATVAAKNLSSKRYPPILLADLRARAHGALANACRLNDDFDQAEKEFSKACSLLDEGTGDPAVFGHLLDLEASLRTDQRRLPEAMELLDHAERCYREAGEPHLVGKVVIQKGVNTFYAGRARAAVELIREGLAKLDPDRDPQLLARSQHNLVFALVECGELHEANAQLLKSGLRQAFAGEPINLLRLDWDQARILAGQNKLDRAEAVLQEVRAGFYAQEMFYDAALVGLELAGVWLQMGKTVEVREIADDARQTFEDLGVHVEALRAIRFFQEACRQDLATVGLVRDILRFLQRLEWNPQLRFAM